MARVRHLSRRKARDEHGACIVEGVHATQQALAAGLAVEAVLVCPERVRTRAARDWLARLRRDGRRVVEVGEGRFARLAGRDNPVAVLAVAHWRPRRLEELRPDRLRLAVLAEDLDDAGNLGSLIRTADAAGADVVVAAGPGADPAQRKCLRASLGTAFRLPVARAASTSEALDWLRGAGCTLIGTSPGGASPYAETRYPLPVAVAFGNERHGLRAATLAACDRRVRVPLYGAVDSLNVTVAAGVVLYEVRRQMDAGGGTPRPPRR